MLYRDLPVLGGVANILRVGTFDVGELAAQSFDDVFGFVEAQRCLSQIRYAIGIGNGQRIDLRRGSYDLSHGWSFAQSANGIPLIMGLHEGIVIAMADENERVAFFRELHGLHVDLRYQRAGGVDDAQSALFAGIADFRGNAVRAVNDAFAGGNFVHRIDKDGAFALELFDHKAVVNNLFADVNWRTEGLERDADDIDRPDDAGAESAGLKQEQGFLAFRQGNVL